MKEQKTKQEYKNKDFIQFYRKHIDILSELASNKKALDLFILLCKHMDGTNALCVSYQVLCELLNCSRMTVSRAVKYLKDKGYVCVLKSGSSNIYVVNPDIAWTSYGNQKKYCKFQSTVLLSSTENNEILNNPKATTRFKTIDSSFIESTKERKEQFENEVKRIKEA